MLCYQIFTTESGDEIIMEIGRQSYGKEQNVWHLCDSVVLSTLWLSQTDCTSTAVVKCCQIKIFTL